MTKRKYAWTRWTKIQQLKPYQLKWRSKTIEATRDIESTEEILVMSSSWRCLISDSFSMI